MKLLLSILIFISLNLFSLTLKDFEGNYKLISCNGDINNYEINNIFTLQVSDNPLEINLISTSTNNIGSVHFIGFSDNPINIRNVDITGTLTMNSWTRLENTSIISDYKQTGLDFFLVPENIIKKQSQLTKNEFGLNFKYSDIEMSLPFYRVISKYQYECEYELVR